jgi:hypothetical protein
VTEFGPQSLSKKDANCTRCTSLPDISPIDIKRILSPRDDVAHEALVDGPEFGVHERAVPTLSVGEVGLDAVPQGFEPDLPLDLQRPQKG